jgi:hypothetical protein
MRRSRIIRLVQLLHQNRSIQFEFPPRNVHSESFAGRVSSVRTVQFSSKSLGWFKY